MPCQLRSFGCYKSVGSVQRGSNGWSLPLIGFNLILMRSRGLGDVYKRQLQRGSNGWSLPLIGFKLILMVLSKLLKGSQGKIYSGLHCSYWRDCSVMQAELWDILCGTTLVWNRDFTKLILNLAHFLLTIVRSLILVTLSFSSFVLSPRGLLSLLIMSTARPTNSHYS